MKFTGTWRIVSSPDFDDDYLTEETEPFVSLKQCGSQVTGDYHVGLQSGNIDGEVQKDGSVAFSFEGMDEMDEVNGRGSLHLNGDRLTFILNYHQGDTFTYEGVPALEE
ncbi:MAG TPA: hypothetical protein VKU00_16620 [Chthonomonadaceae bacterium]|nr:hypothetical protein [Chthonomonadaceae bacterium]